MSLHRADSSISVEDVRGRLDREGAKVGAVTVSLAWNNPSDLDLHAVVAQTNGQSSHICYRNKADAASGGHLDVDMHYRDSEIISEPVENIYWEHPPAGNYVISARLYKRRGADVVIPFKALLTFEGQEPLMVEGSVQVGACSANCFEFDIGDDGGCTSVIKVDQVVNAATLGKAKGKAAASAKAKAVAKAKSVGKTNAAPAKSQCASKAPKVPVSLAKSAKRVAKKGATKNGAKVVKGKPALKRRPSKFDVFKGKKAATKKGLKKEDFVLSKKKKVVTVRKSEAGRKSGLFALATARAYKKLGMTGFTPVKKGSAFYKAAREELAMMTAGA